MAKGPSAQKIAQLATAADKAATVISSTTQTAQDAFNQSQASADKAMQFSAAQAAEQMAFQKAMMENMQAYNSAEAAKQRKWQEQMRATAYQATVKDMIAAGINPIMAAQLGATGVGTGATASSGMPSGAMGQSAQAHMEQQIVPNMIRTIGYAVGTAKAAAEALPDYQKKEAEKVLNDWSGEKLRKFVKIENGRKVGEYYRR